MTKTIQALIFLVTATFGGIIFADATDGAEQVFEKFFTSFTNADPDNIVSLFSEDALFWGTGSQSLVKATDGIRSYFSGMRNRTPGQVVARAADISILPLNENQAMISGTWQVIPEGQSEGTVLRVSAVVSNLSGEWKIVQFHNSRVPE
jgi:uncharacterized protein (TIGR02246 family)